MKQSVVMIGMGEMGGVFARGFLRLGYPVYPVTRSMNIHTEASYLTEPAAVIVAVAENDLDKVLAEFPANWRSRMVLLQNELLPRDWQRHGIENPTVISVWFEKKRGQDVKVLIPSLAFGPHASDVASALATIDVAVRVLENAEQLEYELVRKNVYILTTNICGLVVGGNVKELWESHRELATRVANEVIDIEESKVGHAMNREQLIQGLEEGIKGDLHHKCMGRTALARLQRALGIADEKKLSVAKLREIAASQTKTE